MEHNKKTTKSLIYLISSGNIDHVEMALNMLQALNDNDITTNLLGKVKLIDL